MEFDLNKLIDSSVSVAILSYFLRLVLTDISLSLKLVLERLIELGEITRKCNRES